MEELTGASNTRFELMVLGACLTNRDSWEAVQQALPPDAFYHPDHQALHAAIREADEEDRWGDSNLIAQRLVDQGMTSGFDLVTDAMGDPAPHATLEGYISDLRGRYIQRLTHEVARAQLATPINGNEAAAAETLSDLQDKLRDITLISNQSPWETLTDVMSQVVDHDQQIAAHLPTGLPDLDRLLQGGFRPGQMVTFAARPGAGKSTLAMNIAVHAAVHRDIPGAFVSLEMSNIELATRIASSEGNIPLDRLLKGKRSPEDTEKVRQVHADIDASPLLLIDAADSSWGSIRAKIQSACHQEGIRFAVLDYLQLITLENRSSQMGRQEEVATISRGIKTLARSLGITIIAVAQLNRGPEQRSGNVPVISDLRESGSIEQDSDVVGLIHRPDMYDPMSERAGEADLIVAKHRNGATGTETLVFQGHYARFASMANEEPPPATDGFGIPGPYPYPEA